jgi:hypothetical protein
METGGWAPVGYWDAFPLFVKVPSRRTDPAAQRNPSPKTDPTHHSADRPLEVEARALGMFVEER